MYDHKKTRLWEETLGQIDDPKDEFKPHEFLRTIYFTFRERAIGLSEEIARDLPDFPSHDVGHFDALWLMADLIIGSNERFINPMEAFILGCSFLIHDLVLQFQINIAILRHPCRQQFHLPSYPSCISI